MYFNLSWVYIYHQCLVKNINNKSICLILYYFVVVFVNYIIILFYKFIYFLRLPADTFL